MTLYGWALIWLLETFTDITILYRNNISHNSESKMQHKKSDVVRKVPLVAVICNTFIAALPPFMGVCQVYIYTFAAKSTFTFLLCMILDTVFQLQILSRIALSVGWSSILPLPYLSNSCEVFTLLCYIPHLQQSLWVTTSRSIYSAFLFWVFLHYILGLYCVRYVLLHIVAGEECALATCYIYHPRQPAHRPSVSQLRAAGPKVVNRGGKKITHRQHVTQLSW